MSFIFFNIIENIRKGNCEKNCNWCELFSVPVVNCIGNT